MLFIALAAIGVVDAIYTTYEYTASSFNSCNINSYLSCSGVAASGHTSIFGIPFYVTGLVWFPLLFVLGFVTSHGANESINATFLLPVLMIGNIFTIYLWYLELAVIGIICPSCVSLYVINYALTGIAAAELF